MTEQERRIRWCAILVALVGGLIYLAEPPAWASYAGG